MPELRKDPVIGRWVIIATERARRPGNIVDRQRNVFADQLAKEFFEHYDITIDKAWRVHPEVDRDEGVLVWKIPLSI